jgi:hypothetical protein
MNATIRAPVVILTLILVAAPLVAQAQPPPTFDDVPTTHPMFQFIESLASAGVAVPCSPTPPLYCPDAPVTRAQLPMFIIRAKVGPGYVPPSCDLQVFADVPCSHPYARWINELARRGVATACAGFPGNYCPGEPVTRAQIAVFLIKANNGAAYLPPACSAAPFVDVPCANPYASWIAEFVRRGIAVGCAPELYCPTELVSRGVMAMFLVRAFSLPTL